MVVSRAEKFTSETVCDLLAHLFINKSISLRWICKQLAWQKERRRIRNSMAGGKTKHPLCVLGDLILYRFDLSMSMTTNAMGLERNTHGVGCWRFKAKGSDYFRNTWMSVRRAYLTAIMTKQIETMHCEEQTGFRLLHFS